MVLHLFTRVVVSIAGTLLLILGQAMSTGTLVPFLLHQKTINIRLRRVEGLLAIRSCAGNSAREGKYGRGEDLSIERRDSLKGALTRLPSSLCIQSGLDILLGVEANGCVVLGMGHLSCVRMVMLRAMLLIDWA